MLVNLFMKFVYALVARILVLTIHFKVLINLIFVIILVFNAVIWYPLKVKLSLSLNN
jgi:hypothetical protein